MNKLSNHQLFSELPTSWERCAIDDVGAVQIGRQRSPAFLKGVNPTPYIRAANITSRGVDLSDIEEMDFSLEEIERFALQAGDIVFAEASGSGSQVGRPAIWKEALPSYCFQNTVLRFRPLRVVPEFALLVFRYLFAVGVFQAAARGVGIQHLSAERFRCLPFPLPPESVQRSLVLRTEHLEARLQRCIEKIKRAATGTSEYTARMRANLRSSLDSCPMVPLGDLVDAHNGRAFKSSEWSAAGLPIVRIGNLKRSDAAFNHYHGEVSDRHKITHGDLLFAWSGTPETSFGAHLWRGGEAALNQHIFKLVPKDSHSREYIRVALDWLLPEFVLKARGGGGLAHLSRADFLNTRLPLPDLETQHEVVRRATEIEAHRNRQEQLTTSALKRVDQLLKETLSKAVHGSFTPDPIGVDLKPAHAPTDHQQVVVVSPVAAKAPKGSVRKYGRSSRPSLATVLSDTGPLSAQELMTRSGLRSDLDTDVAQFYKELTAGISAGLISASAGQLHLQHRESTS